MSRVADAFARARDEQRAALIIYLCAGDPSLELTPRLIEAAAGAGADVLEVGMPFSDPTADGETIQRASERALSGGATLRGVLDAVRQARSVTRVPVVLFGYYNPILRYGEAALARDAKDAGGDGLLQDAAARVAGSFLYYVSTTGVTGAGGADLSAAAHRAAEVRRRTGKPVAVGFGVRTPEDVAVVAERADGVVVGSAVVRAIEAAPDADAAVAAVRDLVGRLAAATRR